MGAFMGTVTSCKKSCRRIAICLLSVTTVAIFHLAKQQFPMRGDDVFIRVNSEYVVDTPGCRIPYTRFLYKQVTASHRAESCGKRLVFVEKTSDTQIKFTIAAKHFSRYKGFKCCYSFVSPFIVESEANMRIKYSNCVKFKNGAKVYLEQEVIVVECHDRKMKSIYKDSYIMVKKQLPEQRLAKKWNVLIFGIDSVSRARVYNEMPKTVQYMKQEGWLDFQGYQKVASNTYPNIMAFLTGENGTTSRKMCSDGMNQCNQRLMWSYYKKAGYFTAYGEDNLELTDTFANYGYRERPTHHYMRPFYLTGEQKVKSSLCAHKKPTIETLVKYAYDFATTYKEERFFGLFWSNGNTHNTGSVGPNNDRPVQELLRRLKDAGILSNTIVFLVSDHGRRFGPLRLPIEGYYDDRLPMLFMWLPSSFRDQYTTDYNNALRNQIRLVTTYDLYMTLRDIAGRADSSVAVPRAGACAGCRSLLALASEERTCPEAGVDSVHCTCDRASRLDWTLDSDGRAAVAAVVAELQNVSARVRVRKCYACVRPRLGKVLRVHRSTDARGDDHYVVALEAVPGQRSYELYAARRGAGAVRVSGFVSVLFPWDSYGMCVLNKYEGPFCYCRYQCRYGKGK